MVNSLRVYIGNKLNAVKKTLEMVEIHLKFGRWYVDLIEQAEGDRRELTICQCSWRLPKLNNAHTYDDYCVVILCGTYHSLSMCATTALSRHNRLPVTMPDRNDDVCMII